LLHRSQLYCCSGEHLLDRGRRVSRPRSGNRVPKRLRRRHAAPRGGRRPPCCGCADELHFERCSVATSVAPRRVRACGIFCRDILSGSKVGPPSRGARHWRSASSSPHPTVTHYRVCWRKPLCHSAGMSVARDRSVRVLLANPQVCGDTKPSPHRWGW
jgi:hypothetical protein